MPLRLNDNDSSCHAALSNGVDGPVHVVQHPRSWATSKLCES